MYQQSEQHSKSQPLLPLHASSSSSSSPTSSPPASPCSLAFRPSSSRRRMRRSFSCSPATGVRIPNNKHKRSMVLRSSTFTKYCSHQQLLFKQQQQQQQQELPQHYHHERDYQEQLTRLPPPQQQQQQQVQSQTAASSAAAASAAASGSSVSVSSIGPPLARIHSGSAVAGFVVGTTFEACLMGWLACLHVKGAAEDPPLFLALLALFLFGSWSGIFHIVLWHMDALVDMGPPGAVNPMLLYGHFNGGLAFGLGLECTILHHILQQRSQAAAALLQLVVLPWRSSSITTSSTTTLWGSSLGMVSIVFGLGCVGLTVVRSYYTPGGGARSISNVNTNRFLATSGGRGSNNNNNNNMKTNAGTITIDSTSKSLV